MLKNEIRDLWDITPVNHARAIYSILQADYPAWTVKYSDMYGVAIPYDYQELIKEDFSNVSLSTGEIVFNDEVKKALILSSSDIELREAFSSLCAEFVLPGEDGAQREELIRDPVGWWVSWKRLLGNKNIDAMVYDVIGEMYSLLTLAQKGYDAQWDGPTGATFDIDCGEVLFEVKSSVVRKQKNITVHSKHQLDMSDKRLYIVFCQFERAINGYSINQLVDLLVQAGYSKSVLERKLSSLGFKEGKSDRARYYYLISASLYEVDEHFPRIADDMFKEGLPTGILDYTYTVSLDSLSPSEVWK